MQAEDVGHRSRPSDDRQISFIQILEGVLLRFALYFPHNRLRGMLWRSVTRTTLPRVRKPGCTPVGTLAET